MCRDRCEKPLELRVFSDTDFVSKLTQRPVLGGPTIVEPEIRQLYPEIEPDSPTTQFLQRDHSEAGECELNHRWRHGSHRSTGDEAHNSSSTDKRQGITSAARSTFRRLPICRQAIIGTARPETKPAKSETLLILTLLEIPDSNLLWHIRCSDSQAQLVSRRIANESH